VQLSGQPGDHHAVSLISLVTGVILLLTGDMGNQRLHAHQRQAPLGTQPLHLQPPRPVGSHATATDAKPFALACPAAQSSASPSRNAFTRTVLRASTRTS